VTIAACAALVQRGDPDRFLAVMAAPVWARERLFPLYAFNLEVARAPWVSREPLIAEMRLQWWRDTVAAMAGDGPLREHEVALPLARLVRDRGLPVPVLDRMVAARSWDVGTDPFAEDASLEAYLMDTGGGLMWLAARALGASAVSEAAARDAGWAAGLAAFLRAVPALRARGRRPLPDDHPAAVAALAQTGLDRLARAGRGGEPALRIARLAGWQTTGLLRRVVRDPASVAEGRLALSDFARRGGLLWAALRAGMRR
jgi:phytoene/squalene synthetase